LTAGGGQGVRSHSGRGAALEGPGNRWGASKSVSDFQAHGMGETETGAWGYYEGKKLGGAVRVRRQRQNQGGKASWRFYRPPKPFGVFQTNRLGYWCKGGKKDRLRFFTWRDLGGFVGRDLDARAGPAASIIVPNGLGGASRVRKAPIGKQGDIGRKVGHKLTWGADC